MMGAFQTFECESDVCLNHLATESASLIEQFRSTMLNESKHDVCLEAEVASSQPLDNVESDPVLSADAASESTASALSPTNQTIIDPATDITDITNITDHAADPHITLFATVAVTQFAPNLGQQLQLSSGRVALLSPLLPLDAEHLLAARFEAGDEAVRLSAVRVHTMSPANATVVRESMHCDPHMVEIFGCEAQAGRSEMVRLFRCPFRWLGFSIFLGSTLKLLPDQVEPVTTLVLVVPAERRLVQTSPSYTVSPLFSLPIANRAEITNHNEDFSVHSVRYIQEIAKVSPILVEAGAFSLAKFRLKNLRVCLMTSHYSS